MKESIHPHGNWGLFGNGFGIGRLLGWKNDTDYIQASMLGISFAMPTTWESVLEGYNVRNVIIGLNNYYTTLLNDLVRAGFSASLNTPESVFSHVLSNQFNEFPSDLSKKYYLLHSYFKFYPYCRFCHSPVDVVLDLVRKGEKYLIKEIRVKTYSHAAKLNAQEVRNDFEGKFSIPYAVAMELCKRDSEPNEQTYKAVKSLMKRIVVNESSEYTNQLPEKRITSVEIEFLDGTVRKQTVDRATGDPDEHNLKDKVIEKSKKIITTWLEKDKANELIGKILQLEEVEDIREVFSYTEI